MNNPNPKELATDLLKSLNIRSSPVPVDKIAKAMGVQLKFSPLDDELSGMIFIKDGTPIIGVNALHHSNRQRFTIAHEIGHLVMHRNILENEVHVDKQFKILMRDGLAATGTDLIEIQANQFAAELLLPSFLLDTLLSKEFDIDDEGPLDALAKKFKVSKQMLEYRIRSFR
jgi:Zn-dependent peptidase ImmA (M78 family)